MRFYVGVGAGEREVAEEKQKKRSEIPEESEEQVKEAEGER